MHETVILNALLRIEARLTALETAITTGRAETMSALDDLTAQVAKNTSLEQSAITLIQGLAQQIAASVSDPAKLTALAGQLSTSASALAAAIAANTPAAPTPAPVAPSP